MATKTHNTDTVEDCASLDEAPKARRLHFNATLYVHRSLKRKNFNRMIMILAAFCLFAAIRFIMIGAWPVVIFVGIDLVALWLAFHFNYRAAQRFETVQLTDRDLLVTRVHPNGRAQTWRFEPYWVQVRLRKLDDGENELSLRSHGERLSFGHFMLPDERREFALALESALTRWRRRIPVDETV
ncbi:DUF2244 domain-containing protein [Kordiimonas aestuarii]|uniref:DUF2244 domain-containing protein n=1 Tax=Kordiimonas aestuarii TaxID=1005925 RepID=UPI0021D1C086|nr:DUF2244 domain-containing protein [Kordiimonas aestuarii]